MIRNKLYVEIHKSGSLNDEMIRMITNHNEGRINITLDYFAWCMKVNHASYNLTKPKPFYIFNGDNEADNPREWRSIDISEDEGKTFTLTITERPQIIADPNPDPITNESTN